MRNELAEVRGAVMRIESVTLATGVRVARLDNERELPQIKIDRLRQEVRRLEHRTPRQSQPEIPFDALDTGQRSALKREDAEKLIADAAKTARLVELEKRFAAGSEWATAWRRALVPVFIAAVLGAAFTYAVSRATQPRYRQTVEQK